MNIHFTPTFIFSIFTIKKKDFTELFCNILIDSIEKINFKMNK